MRCKTRDKLQHYLLKEGIESQIHYPIPPHLANCYQYLDYHIGDFPVAERFSKEILSLPLYNGMSLEEQQYVIDKINLYEG